MIVALVGTLCFALLLLLNWTIGRSLLYPGVALAGIWMLEFITQVFSVGILYPISWYALAIFVGGCIAFTAGAVLGNGGFRRAPVTAVAPMDHRSDRVLLWILAVLLLLGVPVFLKEVGTFTSARLFSPEYFQQVRTGLLDQAATSSRAPLVDNLVVLSSIVALIAYAVTDAARRCRLLVGGLVALAIFYNLLTASKAGAVALVVAMFAVHIVLRRRVPIRFLLISFVGVLALFGVVTVGRVESLGQNLTWQQSVEVTWQQFLSYFSASPVGFSVYLANPASVPAVWSPWRFFMSTANYFGHYFSVPDLNAQFVDVGSGLSYNTYTAYFSYYPAYGMVGVLAFMAAIGAVVAWIFRRAQTGALVWLVLYGTLFNGLLHTIFNENLMLALNYMIKLAVVAGFVLFMRRVRLKRLRGLPKGYRVRFGMMGRAR